MEENNGKQIIVIFIIEMMSLIKLWKEQSVSPASTLSTDPVQTEQHSELKDFDLKDLKDINIALHMRQTWTTIKTSFLGGSRNKFCHEFISPYNLHNFLSTLP